MPLRILNITKDYSKQHKELLENNPIGSPGISMVYQHRRVNDKLKKIPKPWFVNLRRGENLIGTCCFCEREEREITNYYIRYFAFEKSRRIQRNSGTFKTTNSRIKEEVQEVLESKHFDSKNKNHLFYAYIDPTNERSKVICEGFGFQQVRTFKSILISRRTPKSLIEFETVSSENNTYLRNELKEFYSEYNFYNEENLFFDNGYFVHKEDGQIVAGIQAVEEKWWIYELPGLLGKLLLKYGEKLPLLKKLIQNDFRFLALEAPYYKPGYESRLEQLIESVMAKKGYHVSMIVLDSKSQQYNIFNSFDKGLISKLNTPKENQVIVKTNKTINDFLNKPAYISTIDLT